MKVNIFTTENKYDIIYADPPWGSKYSSGLKNARGTARQHYSVMSDKEICSLPVKDIVKDNSICFLWSTFPCIESALKVLKSWGFRYITNGFTWIKTYKKSDSLFWGMGQYTRANAEVCLIGVGKSFKATKQIKTHKIHSVIYSQFKEHSKKPDEARERIVELLGDLPRIELFARQHADGWDCWGNEC